MEGLCRSNSSFGFAATYPLQGRLGKLL